MIRIRLKIARLNRGFATALDAGEYIKKHRAVMVGDDRPLQVRSYQAYESGERKMSYSVLEQLERLFEVPRGWLRIGDGETEEQLLAKLDQLEAKAGFHPTRFKGDRPSLRAARVSAERNSKDQAGVNQLTPNGELLDIKLSNSLSIRRIPILSGDEVARFLTGQRDFPMLGRAIAVPESIELGPGCFGYAIAENDRSMEGAAGVSFPPGTELIIDADQDVLPDNFLLARPRGMKGWLLRQYQAGLPLSMAREYTLRALNPAVDPIRVTDPDDWEIGGRLIRTLHKW